MKNVNWEQIPDNFKRPTAGGYIARITMVEDCEAKEYLRLGWDYFEGPFKGTNQETYDKRGFWPTSMICSYKEKALPFFKGFKTAVERSNQNYTFQNDPQSLVGKLVGVILGEEEYIKNGEVKTRLYVAEKRSVKAIRDGDYQVPELKRLSGSSRNEPHPAFASKDMEFSTIEDDEELPF